MTGAYFKITEPRLVKALNTLKKQQDTILSQWRDMATTLGADAPLISDASQCIGFTFTSPPRNGAWKAEFGGFTPRRNTLKGKELATLLASLPALPDLTAPIQQILAAEQRATVQVLSIAPDALCIKLNAEQTLSCHIDKWTPLTTEQMACELAK